MSPTPPEGGRPGAPESATGDAVEIVGSSRQPAATVRARPFEPHGAALQAAPVAPAPTPPRHPASADDFTPEKMLGPVVTPPRGWRGAVYRVSGGRVTPGPGTRELRERELIERIRTPINGTRRVAVLSRKGGIGKTTTTLMLGHTLATHRGDRVVALDANPDAGSLAYRVRRETGATITQLLQSAPLITSYSDVRRFTNQAATRLEVVAGDDDPTISETLGADDYRRAITTLERHFNLVIVDTGTGILDRATQGILRMVDQIVICAAPGLDASRASSFTLDWLEQHSYLQLAREAVVVLNQVGRAPIRTVDAIAAHFARRCRAVIEVPFDPKLAEGAESTLDELRPATREAYLAVAAAVADSFAEAPLRRDR